MPDRRALLILFSALFLVMLGVGIIIPNIAYRAAELHASSIEIALLFTLYSLMQFLFAPIWGRLSDRIGRRPVLIAGLFGGGAGLLLFGAGDRLLTLYLARGLSGLMSSAALPTAMAYVADVTDEKRRGHGMGAMGAAMGLGFIFGPGIGGALAQFGHAVPFLVAGGLMIVTGIAATMLLPESLRQRAPASAGAWFHLPAPWKALGSPLARFYGVAFTVPFAMAALETTFPLLLRDRLGMGAHEMGWMFLFMGTAVFLVQGFLLGRVINAAGEERVMRAGLLINAAGFLLVPRATGVIGLTAALVLCGVGNQVMRPTNASLLTKRNLGGQGEAIGVMDSFDSLGRILGPVLAGPVYGWAPHAPYLVSASILALCFALLLITSPRAGVRQPAA
jgi:DHA1 family multidrug resistance protein-like MFS transporter